MYFRAARIQYIVPFSFVFMILSRSSSLKRSIGFSPLSRTPALFTRISILPNASTALSIRFSQAALSEMSVGTARTVPPSAFILSATALRGSIRRADITTVAPSFANASAVASPTPEFAPVITATFPFKRSIFLSS